MQAATIGALDRRYKPFVLKAQRASSNPQRFKMAHREIQNEFTRFELKSVGCR